MDKKTLMFQLSWFYVICNCYVSAKIILRKLQNLIIVVNEVMYILWSMPVLSFIATVLALQKVEGSTFCFPL